MMCYLGSGGGGGGGGKISRIELFIKVLVAGMTYPCK